jgi:hypothetical protein
MPQPSCTHLNQIRDVKPSASGCEECLKMKDRQFFYDGER